jgi:hypothetical protein
LSRESVTVTGPPVDSVGVDVGVSVVPHADEGAAVDRAGHRVVCDVHRDAVGVGQVLAGEDVADPARRDDLALAQQHDLVGDDRRVVEVVQHDADRHVVVVRQVAHHVEHLDLVAQVEVVGRLVQQQHGGLLRQARRQPHALQLAAGQLVHAPVGHRGHARQVHGAPDGGAPLQVDPAPPGPVGVPAVGDDVAHRHARRRRPLLGEQGDVAGELLAGQGGVAPHRPLAHPDVPLAGSVQPRQGPQDGRLAGAVGPDERRHDARAESERDTVHHSAVVVRQDQFLTGEQRVSLRHEGSLT